MTGTLNFTFLQLNNVIASNLWLDSCQSLHFVLYLTITIIFGVSIATFVNVPYEN